MRAVLKKTLSGKRGTKREMMAWRALIENMDVERLKDLDVDITKADGLAKMFNEVFFHGDWKRHIEWTEKYGSKEQKREDIPLLKNMRKEMRKQR